MEIELLADEAVKVRTSNFQRKKIHTPADFQGEEKKVFE